MVPAACPRRCRGSGRAPCCTCSGPCDGVVPGVSLWRRSWAACAAVVFRAVFRAVRRSTGDSAGALGLFCGDADTSPFGSEDATPGSRACLRVLLFPGRVGRVGLLGALWCASPFLWLLCLSALIGPLRAGVAPFLSSSLHFCLLLSLLCGFFFSFLFVRPCCHLLFLVSGPNCPRPWRCVAPSPAPFRFVFSWFSPRSAWFGVCVLPPPFFPSPFPPLFYAAIFRPPPLPACFVGLPLLGSPCAPAAYMFSAWPLGAPLRLLPLPLVCVLRLSSLPLDDPCLSSAALLPAC